jgi:hypothetical protein
VSDGEQPTIASSAGEETGAGGVSAATEAPEPGVGEPTPVANETEPVEAPSAEATPTAQAAPADEATPAAPAVEAAPASEPAEAVEPAAEPAAPVEPAPAADAAAAAEPAPAAAPVPVPAPPAASAAPAAPAAPAVEAKSAWGRVAADGTVFVRTADGGEREIGNWAAGTPADGLAFYQTRFDGLRTKVDLLERRLRSDQGGKDAAATLAELRGAVTDAHAIGDLAALLGRLDALEQLAEQRRAARKEARAKELVEAAERKERIVAEAESLAESGQWKSTGERLRALVEEWKAVPRLDRKADDELWNRFATARSAFAKRRKSHFAELDAERDSARARKEELVELAEELAAQPITQPTDWAENAQGFRDLMARWKKAGHAQRDVEDKLWVRFKAAQDGFFAARNADLDKRDAGFKENLARKEELLVEAKALLPVTDLKAAKAALRQVQERWEDVGPVPRDAKSRIEGQLREVERAVADAEQAEWQRTNPEARARAEATVRQLEASLEKFETELAKAKTAGNARKQSDAEAAISARREWLEQAQAALAEFTR